MSDPGPSFDDLCRIADILRSVEHFASFRYQHGSVEIEVVRKAGDVAQCVDAAPPVPSAERSFIPASAPCVGTFRRSLGRDAAPPVAPGDRVSAADVLAWVDVLGELAPVTAPVAGRLASVLADDGAPVGYGQTLLLIEAGS
jgi:biotin carboxyl carrier protein